METLFTDRAGSYAHVLFAEDFDDLPGVTVIEARVDGADSTIEPEIIAPVFTALDFEAARETAWEEGRAAGLIEAEGFATAAIRTALAHFSTELEAAVTQADATAEQNAETIAHLLLGSLMTMLPETCARHGETEVRAIVRTVLPPLKREPAITVRVSPKIAAGIGCEIAALDPDLAARVRLIPTDAMARSDVRIVWEDGSAERNGQALWREVAAILSQTGLLMQTDVKEMAFAG